MKKVIKTLLLEAFIKKLIQWFTPKAEPKAVQNQFYKYQGRVFASDEDTIKRLNYALALNGSEERYRKVVHHPSKD